MLGLHQHRQSSPASLVFYRMPWLSSASSKARAPRRVLRRRVRRSICQRAAMLTAALAHQASLFADLSRDIKLQDQVYEKARGWEARWCRAHGARLSRSDDSVACAEQELDKQSVDTNALLKLATAHVRAEPRARV